MRASHDRDTRNTTPASDAGSLPLAMVITVFCIVLSTLALSSLVLSAQRSIADQSATTSQLASDSGTAVAGQVMHSATEGLCHVPYEPGDFQPAPGSEAAFRWWVDKSNIAAGSVKVIVESQSGNPAAPAVTSTSVGYAWDAKANRWEITSRKGEEAHPYPVTVNHTRATTPARFASTPDNRGMGLTLNPGMPNGDNPPALNDGIVSDGRYVWLAGEFSNATGSNETSTTSNIVKFDTATGEVVESFSVQLGDPSDVINSMLIIGDDIVLGGKFTSVNGENRSNLAKINKDTGALIAGFNDGTRNGNPTGPSQRIRTMAYDASRDLILTGGVFDGWNTVSSYRTTSRFAAVSPSTGEPMSTGVQANPNFTEPVEHLAVTGDGVVVAGGRLYASGEPLHRALVTVAADGTVADTGMDVTRGGNTGTLYDIAVDPAHPDQLVAGFGYTGAVADSPEMVRMYRVSDGAVLWSTPTNHDVHTVAWLDGLVYANVHNGASFGDPTTRLFALNDSTGVQDSSFLPTFPAWDGSDYANYWGATKMTATRQGLAAFGAFTDVSSQSVNNFAWFPNSGGC